MGWGMWDIRMLKAYHMLQDMMQGDWPVWIAQSDRISWETQKKVDRPKASLDKAMEEKNPPKGRVYHVIPKVNDGGEWPTLEEWIADKADKNKGSNRSR